MSTNNYKNIKFEIKEGIAHLTLARHDIRNAFSEIEFTEEILDAVQSAQHSTGVPGVRVVRRRQCFFAGGNVKDMRDKKGIFGGGPAGTRRGYMEGIQRVPKALYGLDIPSISAVQGPRRWGWLRSCSSATLPFVLTVQNLVRHL